MKSLQQKIVKQDQEIAQLEKLLRSCHETIKFLNGHIESHHQTFDDILEEVRRSPTVSSEFLQGKLHPDINKRT